MPPASTTGNQAYGDDPGIPRQIEGADEDQRGRKGGERVGVPIDPRMRERGRARQQDEEGEQVGAERRHDLDREEVAPGTRTVGERTDDRSQRRGTEQAGNQDHGRERQARVVEVHQQRRQGRDEQHTGDQTVHDVSGDEDGEAVRRRAGQRREERDADVDVEEQPSVEAPRELGRDEAPEGQRRIAHQRRRVGQDGRSVQIAGDRRSDHRDGARVDQTRKKGEHHEHDVRRIRSCERWVRHGASVRRARGTYCANPASGTRSAIEAGTITCCRRTPYADYRDTACRLARALQGSRSLDARAPRTATRLFRLR